MSVRSFWLTAGQISPENTGCGETLGLFYLTLIRVINNSLQNRLPSGSTLVVLVKYMSFFI